MLAFTVLSLFFCLVNAAPNLDLAGPPTPERMFSLAQRHARSSLTKRNECWVDDDCPRVPNAGQSTCNATRCCDVHCNPGFTLVDGQCHQNQQASTSPSAGACPSGKRLFNGACVSAPASALSPKRQCNTDNDCTTGRGHAFATCQNGSCSVVCWQGYVFNGQYCAQASDASCQKTGCVNGPAGSHLIGQCRADGRCTAVCEPGYVFGAGADKYRCYQSSPNSCATTQCLQIVGGTSSCANGVCSYVCSDLNKVPILKNNPTRYRCENTANNPQCCGPSCTRCPSGASSYSGLGTPAPACKAGGCTYDCAVGSLKTDNSGKPYCA